LAWDLQWGTPEKLKFLKTLQEQGQEPEALKNKPRLKPWGADYYRAFQTLSTSRPTGMGGVGAIPLSEMMAYFALSEIRDPDERETYVKMIQALDSTYLTHMNKKSEDAASSSGKKPPRRRR